MSRTPLRVGSPLPRCVNGTEQPQLRLGRAVKPPAQGEET
jgi:hypothetical protein